MVFRKYEASALRLCSFDDLVEALKILAKFTSAGPGISVPNASGTAFINAMIRMRIDAESICGLLWGEIGHRKKLSAAEYEAECQETYNCLQAGFDRADAALQ